MKILILTTFFPPDDSIGGQRPYSWAKYWARAGHSVDVVTITKEKSNKVLFQEINFNSHEVAPFSFFYFIRDLYRKKFKDNKNQDSLKSGPTKSKTGIFKKIFNFLADRGLGKSIRMPDPTDFWIWPAWSFIKRKNVKWDVVVSTFGPYAPHILAMKVKKNGLANFWVADFRDLWVDSPFFSGLYPFTLVEKFIEKSVFRNASLVSTVSDEIADHLQKKYPARKTVTIANGFDLEDVKLNETKVVKKTSKMTICYTGTVYQQTRNPAPLCIAIKNLVLEIPNLDKKLVVNFYGPHSEFLIQLIKDYQLENIVNIHPSVDRQTSLKIQRESDFLLFLETMDPSFVGVLTGKLFEYLFSGRPIMGVGINENTASGRVIVKAQGGEIFGQDANSIATYLKGCLTDGVPEYKVDQDYIQTFTRKNQADKLLSLIENELKQ